DPCLSFGGERRRRRQRRAQGERSGAQARPEGAGAGGASARQGWRRGGGGPARGSTGGSPARTRLARGQGGRQAGRRVTSGLSALDSNSAAAAGAADLAAPKRRRSISGSADWRADVEEDGGGGVENFRREAPDHPRPSHQRYGLTLSAKLRHEMIKPFHPIWFITYSES
ncbi:unnamed protein product, partial [Urochloa humidicola]